jgi:hypothetical protein
LFFAFFNFVLSIYFICFLDGFVGTANREGNFHDKARNLTEHALRAADTARMVAAGGSNQNKRAVEGLMNAANHVRFLSRTFDYSQVQFFWKKIH